MGPAGMRGNPRRSGETRERAAAPGDHGLCGTHWVPGPWVVGASWGPAACAPFLGSLLPGLGPGRGERETVMKVQDQEEVLWKEKGPHLDPEKLRRPVWWPHRLRDPKWPRRTV